MEISLFDRDRVIIIITTKAMVRVSAMFITTACLQMVSVLRFIGADMG